MKELNKQSSTTMQSTSQPISMPSRQPVHHAGEASSRNDGLVELFEPSSPSRPQLDGRRQSWMADSSVVSCTKCDRPFTLFLRRHHCRRCGRIFCAECSNNRITNLRSLEDKDYYRLCDDCIDELIGTGRATLLASDRCGLGFALRYRKLAAVEQPHHAHHPLPSRSRTNSQCSQSSAGPAEGGPVAEERPVDVEAEDHCLLKFDEELATAPSTTRRVSMAPFDPTLFTPVVSAGSTPTNEGFLARIAAAALSLPARLRTTASSANKVPSDNTLELCPVCSTSFRKWDNERMQKHVMDCIQRTEATGSVKGNRYTSYRCNTPGENTECSICFEDFEVGQMIAVLNCLCQFHEKCIDAWFERGKCCPFHVG